MDKAGTAQIFDLDNTLLVTEAKSDIIMYGQHIAALDANEINSYAGNNHAVFDHTDFADPWYLRNSNPGPMLHFAQQINNNTEDEIFILTARSDEVEEVIWDVLVNRYGLSRLDPGNVHCLGNNPSTNDIPLLKCDFVKNAANYYKSVFFYDDSLRTCKFCEENCPKNCFITRV